MLSSPFPTLVLPKAGRDKGGAHQQVADLDQPLYGFRLSIPAAALLPTPGPLRLPLALLPGIEGGGQLGLWAAPQGPADHAPPDLLLAEEVAVRAALCPGHVDPSLPSHRCQATNTASRQD